MSTMTAVQYYRHELWDDAHSSGHMMTDWMYSVPVHLNNHYVESEIERGTTCSEHLSSTPYHDKTVDEDAAILNHGRYTLQLFTWPLLPPQFNHLPDILTYLAESREVK